MINPFIKLNIRQKRFKKYLHKELMCYLFQYGYGIGDAPVQKVSQILSIKFLFISDISKKSSIYLVAYKNMIANTFCLYHLSKSCKTFLEKY